MAIRILKRDITNRTIEIECPHCSKPVPLRDKNIERLEDELDTIGPCPHCHQQFSVRKDDLDGPIWQPPMALKDACPHCGGRDFNLLVTMEEAPGQHVEHRQCANPACGQEYRRPGRFLG